jgi:hypothetical protein
MTDHVRARRDCCSRRSIRASVVYDDRLDRRDPGDLAWDPPDHVADRRLFVQCRHGHEESENFSVLVGQAVRLPL